MSGCESSSPNEGCIQIRLGKNAGADNYYHCECCIKEETFSVALPRSQALKRAVLQEARWDDRLQIWINDKKACKATLTSLLKAMEDVNWILISPEQPGFIG